MNAKIAVDMSIEADIAVTQKPSLESKTLAGGGAPCNRQQIGKNATSRKGRAVTPCTTQQATGGDHEAQQAAGGRYAPYILCVV